jgi:hypothetical protein
VLLWLRHDNHESDPEPDSVAVRPVDDEAAQAGAGLVTELEELLQRLIAEREQVPMPRWVLTTAAGQPVPSRPRPRSR